jgi:hypothetical protein
MERYDIGGASCVSNGQYMQDKLIRIAESVSVNILGSLMLTGGIECLYN